MDKYKIVSRIEKFAPPELAENWDCSGWAVDSLRQDITKIMLALTVTEDVVKQAKEQNCDMIISHHPLFFVPLEWKDINIYSAHTNLDRTNGGTTDTLIKSLGFETQICPHNSGYLRYIRIDISLSDFLKKLKQISPNLRYVNNHGIKKLHKIAFCAGSGSEFIQEANENGADAIVTGDLKFHTALESPIVVFDIGHFESEIPVLSVFEKILAEVATIRAKETSPFRY